MNSASVADRLPVRAWSKRRRSEEDSPEAGSPGACDKAGVRCSDVTLLEIPLAGAGVAPNSVAVRLSHHPRLADLEARPRIARVDAQRRGGRLRSGSNNPSTTRCPVSSLSDVHTHIGRATGRASHPPHVKPEAAIAGDPRAGGDSVTVFPDADDAYQRQDEGAPHRPLPDAKCSRAQHCAPDRARMLIFHRKSTSKTPNRPPFRQARATDRRPTPTSAGSARPVPAGRTSIPNVGRAHGRASHASHVEPEARAARDAPRPSRVCRRRHAPKAGSIGTRTDGGGAATVASPSVRPGRPGARLGGKLDHFGERDQTGGGTFHG